MDSLLELFCGVDDFCLAFLSVWRKQLLATGKTQRQQDRNLSLSEVTMIMIHFHQSHYRTFKAYYTDYVQERLYKEFPGLVSYTRFVEFIPSVLLPLCVYLRSLRLALSRLWLDFRPHSLPSLNSERGIFIYNRQSTIVN